MKNLSILLFCLIATTYSYAQNLNFSDAKFKKLLLTSNSTNSIAIDYNNDTIAIDTNNDGEISLEEANRIKILNVRQDPNLKYKDPNNPIEVNEDYYNEHLPEGVTDLLLFRNLEEIYISDTKSIDLHFKDNDKIRIVRFLVNYPLIRVDRNLIFENCTAVTSIRDVLAVGSPTSTVQNKFSIINCPNVIPSDFNIQNSVRELTIINTPINSISIRAVGGGTTSFSINKLTINNVPTLKSVIIGLLVTLPYLDLANNENLEELIFVQKNDNRSAIRKTKFLNLKGNHNLKKIIGLNYETVDFSDDGLNNLEELDIAVQNNYKYYGHRSGYIYFGITKSVNLNGLPKLKKLIAFNQKFDSIDLSKNPLLEEIDLTNTILNFTSLDLINFNHLKNVKINAIIHSLSSSGWYSPKLSSLKINNNPSLEKLELTNNPIRYFELNNNKKIENILLSNYSSYSGILDENTTFLIADNPKLNSIRFAQHQFETLDLSKNKSLKNIFFRSNNIDMDFLNIRNGSTENMDLRLLHRFKINTICVNDVDIDNIQTQFPNSTIITNCNDIERLSTNNLIKDVITIYPNPVLDNLTIKSPNEIKFIEIYSITGEKVLQKIVNNKSFNVNLSHLKPGNYILKVETNNSSEIKKIIKK